MGSPRPDPRVPVGVGIGGSADVGRQAFVYLNGMLLHESDPDDRLSGDYYWVDPAVDVPRLNMEIGAGDVLALYAPRYADVGMSPVTKLYWTGYQWVSSRLSLSEIIRTFPGVASISVGYDRPILYGVSATLGPVVVVSRADLGAKARKKLRYGIIRFLNRLLIQDVPVLVRPPGAGGDLLEATWRLC